MSALELSEPVLRLLPLAVAAGLDPYLVFLFLAAAPLLGWPGGGAGPLADLATPPALAMAALLYPAEILAGRIPWAATLWNVVNTPVRIVASGLLCLLVLHSVPDTAASHAALLALGGAGLAACVHLARTGWWLELDLEGAPRRIRLLTAAAEDVLVVVLLFLALGHPRAGAVAGGVVLLVGAWGIRPHLTAGFAGHGLVLSAVRGLLARPRWRDGSVLPDPVLEASGADGAAAHSIRSTRAEAWGPGVPGRFRRGWLVVSLAGPTFLTRRFGRGVGTPVSVPLDGAVASRVRSQPLHTVVDLVLPDGRPCGVAVPRSGPGADALRQVFGSGAGSPEPSQDDRVTVQRSADPGTEGSRAT